MIDDGDVSDLIVLADPRGWAGWVFWIVVVGIFWAIASGNEAECEAQACANGQHASLLDGECVCVSEPLP